MTPVVEQRIKLIVFNLELTHNRIIGLRAVARTFVKQGNICGACMAICGRQSVHKVSPPSHFMVSLLRTSFLQPPRYKLRPSLRHYHHNNSTPRSSIEWLGRANLACPTACKDGTSTQGKQNSLAPPLSCDVHTQSQIHKSCR